MTSAILINEIENDKEKYLVDARGRHDSSFVWLPVTTGYQNFGLRVVTGYHWLPGFGPQVSNRLPSVTIDYQLGLS